MDTMLPPPSVNPLTITHPFLFTAQPNGLLGASAANQGRGLPVLCSYRAPVNRLRIGVGTSSGNVCGAIYDATGARLSTSGSVPCGAAGKQDLILLTDVLLIPGLYYFHLAVDNTTALFEATKNDGSPGRVLGGYTDANFPAPATVAVDDNNTGYGFVIGAFHS